MRKLFSVLPAVTGDEEIPVIQQSG